jgi:hypothetical protein
MDSMVKKHYIIAVISFLLIPAVSLFGGLIFSSINPEIAAHTNNYVRNYRLLDLARNAFILAAFLVNIGLWFLTCFFVLKSKQQSYWWLLLAVLGPFGFILLTILKDKAEAGWDLYHKFVRRINVYLRAAYELCAVFIVWILAYQLMVLKRNLMIKHEAATTGVSVAQIINQQNASSGMWAFSEGLEVLYLVVLLYLLWPICFNLGGYLLRLCSGRGQDKAP